MVAVARLSSRHPGCAMGMHSAVSHIGKDGWGAPGGGPTST